MSPAFRIARRELRGGIRGFRIMLVCLALGVAAITSVGTVRDSIEAGLARDGATLLGGDAQVELTYRFAEPAERAWLDRTATAVSEVAEFRSMAATSGDQPRRGLTQVRAVDDAWPLLGEARLDPAIPLDRALAGDGDRPGAVIAPELAARLGIGPGGTLRLGETEFVVGALILSEPDGATGGLAFGPRSLVRRADLAESGLLRPGTLFEVEYSMLLPRGADLDAVAEAASRELSGARWRDRRNGAPGVAEFADRLSSFLMLVGLAGLTAGGIGVSTAVSAYLDGKRPVIGILKTLGAETRTIFATYAIQIGCLVIAGVLAGIVAGLALPLLLAPLIEARLPVPAVFRIWPRPILEAAVFGLLAGAIFTLWPLARAERVRAAALFRDRANPPGGLPRARWILLSGVLVAVLVVAAALFSGLWTLTLWSAAGVAVAFCALLLAARGVRALSRRAAMRLRGAPTLRLALGGLAAPGGEVTPVVLSLGLGLSVLAAIGQIDWNLRSAIARDLPQVAPSFFMIDIQPDQIDAFRARLGDRASVSRIESSPMLRGIITEINGRPAREVAGDHWTLSGDRGVTYSDAPPEGTKITAGEWWDAGYDGAPLISFAAEEGAELGLELGDRLTVNILGRDIEARIASFREVDFSNAGLGFVIAMNPRALAGAPHSFIATVYAEEEDEGAILADTAEAFPNVTAISVRDAIERVSGILAGIASAITWGALVTLATGAAVLIGAAATGVRPRTFEAAVLKTVGATRARVIAVFALRSALTGLAAGAVAVAAGIAAGWGVTRFVMDTDFAVNATSAVAIVAGGGAATLAAGLAFLWAPISVRPARVLRAVD